MSTIGVVGVSTEIFEGDELSCDGEFGLNCGVASDKGILWVCVCIDGQGVTGDAEGGECVESDDIFIFGSLILFIGRKYFSLFGLLSSVLFFNELSFLSCKRSSVMYLKIGVFITSFCIVLICARSRSFQILFTA